MIKNKKNLSERLLPFAVVLTFALSLGVSMYMKKHNLGLERLIGIEGGGMVMAIFIALLLFAIKGVVMFIPLSGLYLAVGAVMNDGIIAFLVNLTGIIGANITNPLSVPFLGSCALQLAGTLGSLYIYKKKIKRKDKPA